MKKDIYNKCFNHPPFFFYIKQKPIKIIQADRVHIITSNVKKCLLRIFTRNLRKTYDLLDSKIHANKVLDRVINYYNGAFIVSHNIIILNFKNIYDDSIYFNVDFIYKVVETVSHETIHYVLNLNNGKESSNQFDNIYLKLRYEGYIL